MKKKLMIVLGTATLVFSMGVSVSATTPSQYATTSTAIWAQSQGYDYAYMCDVNGNFLSRTDFESKLDRAIQNGSIPSTDRNDYLDMYDACNNYMYGNTTRTSGRSCCR